MAAAAAAAAAGGGAAAAAEDSEPAHAYYTATCHRPTIVTHSVKASFTAPEDTNLIIAKVTTLEVYRVSPEGLQPVLDTDVYGRIAVLLPFRVPGEGKDLLFACTEANRYFVLEFDDNKLLTRAYGDVEVRAGRAAERGPRGFVDPEGRVLGLHLYEGQLKIIPITPSGQFKAAFDVKLEELQLLSIDCLHGAPKPTVVLLHEERDTRVVKTYAVDVRDKRLKPGPWSQADVLPQCQAVVALPGDPLAALAVGEVSVAYYKSGESKSVPTAPAGLKAVAVVDNSRVLLGQLRGDRGALAIAALARDAKGRVTGVEVESLGPCSVPSALAYLDEGVVHVGSTYGDSQLVRLTADAGEDGSFVEELDRFANLGPVVDFCVADLDGQQQHQVITCSGAHADGSLRVVRNGVGVTEVAQLEMPEVQGVWPLRAAPGDEHHAALAVSLVGQTAFLSVGAADELDAIEVPGASAAESLHCGNVAGGGWVQVVQREVLLVDPRAPEALARWAPPDDRRISVCAAAPTRLAVACGAELWLLGIGGGAIEVLSHAALEHDVACLDISPAGEGGEEPAFCLAGLWTDFSLRVLVLPSLQQAHAEELGGEIIPRAALVARLEGQPHAFCALGDGSLFSFRMDGATGALSARKCVHLGAKPIALSVMQHGDRTHVFAASDRPTVVYSSNGKLIFSHVNFGEVTRGCAMHTPSFPKSLVLVTSTGLTFGSIDEIQKLQVRAVPLGEAPYRVAFQEATGTVAVATHAEEGGSGPTCGRVKLVDVATWEVLDSVALDDGELPLSVETCEVAGLDGGPVYVVGTAQLSLEAGVDEPKSGRVLLMRAVDGKLHVVSETRVEGAVYCAVGFAAGKVLTAVNSKVLLLELDPAGGGGGGHLKRVCGHYGHVAVLCLKVLGDYILVGDLMRSVTVLLYRADTCNIEELAADEHPHWMTAVEFVDEYNFVGAEDCYNMFTCRRVPDAPSEEKQRTLQATGEIHCGHLVNGILPGTLATCLAQGDGPKSLLFCTQSGSIGTIVAVTRDDFAFLSSVQDSVAKVVGGVGNLDQGDWRAFRSNRRRSPCRGFVDGDLVERYLDLPEATQEQVARGAAGARLVQILENLGRLN